LSTCEYKKRLPEFAGNNVVSIKDILTTFLKFVDDLEVKYEDVLVKMFVQTLEWNARAWYKSLPTATIDGWEFFKRKFIAKWGDKEENSFLLVKFTSSRKNKNKIVS
jgi:hypothetical protein